MRKIIILTLTALCCIHLNVLSQNEITDYSYYQITSAWYLSPVDTLDITEDFSDDYYFAFFIEDDQGEVFFTIRSHEHNHIICLGEVMLDSIDEDGEYTAYIFDTNVFCDEEQEESLESIILENIPGSKEETGFDFYYIWLVMNTEEALVFQCFDATNLEEEEDEIDINIGDEE